MEQRLRIGIVDDDIYLQKTLADIFKIKGFEVLSYYSGQEVIRRISDDQLAVVLLDLRLEDAFGLELLRTIKQRSPDTECIVLTGHASQDSAIQAIHRGAYSYIPKPYDVDQLLLIVGQAAEKRANSMALRASEARFRALIEHSIDIITLLNAEGAVLYHSPSMTSILGYSVQERLGQSSFDLLHPDEVEFLRKQKFPEILAKPFQLIPIEMRARHKNGEYRWFEGSAANLLSDPAVQAIVLNYRDVTLHRQSAQQLRQQSAALEAAANAIVITDVEGRVQWANRAFLQLNGYVSAEVIGKTMRELLKSGQNSPLLYQQMWQTILAGQVWRGELINQRKDGSFYTGEMTITPIYDEPGRHFIAVQQDVTDRKMGEAQMERRLADLEVLYQISRALSQLLEPVEIGQRIINLLAERLHWHHAIVRHYHPEHDAFEVLAFSSHSVKVSDLQAERLRLQVAISRSGVGLTGWVLAHGIALRVDDLAADTRYKETYSGMKSGLYVPIQVGERIIGVISVESEHQAAFTPADEQLVITLAAQAGAAIENARLYAETRRRLQELDSLTRVSAAMRTANTQEKMLPVILEQIIAILPADGAMFVFRDPLTGETEYGLGAGVLGGHARLRLPPGEGVAGKVLETGQAYVSQDVREVANLHIALPQTARPQAAALIPLTVQNQTFGAMVVCSENEIRPEQVSLLNAIADIASNAMRRAALHEQTVRYADELEQRVAERTAELSRANADLQRANRAKDEFLANMSHELRTPLNGILGMTEVLMEQVRGPINPRQRASLEVIGSSGHHLLELINDILDLSKIEAGRVELYPYEISVDEICQASLVFIKESAAKKSILVEYEQDLAASTIVADPKRLKQILVNLLSNAVKFTPEQGHVALRVRPDKAWSALQFTVTDTGIGIAPGDVQKLFKPFVQIDSSLNRQYEGAGLGLALVNRLVHLHGGSIHVESELRHGSSFTISLPWDRSLAFIPARPSAQGMDDPDPNNVLAAAEAHSQDLILLVEDNETNVVATTDYLQSCGYHILFAADGETAVAKTEAVAPSLILMDIQMAGLDGLSAIRQIRASAKPQIAQIPIIALTALAMPGDRQRCLDAGANAYFSKPVGLRQLADEIRLQLTKAQYLT